MSTRYEQLFRLPANLYYHGAPVVVNAGALLQDKETGTLLAQLKIQNIQDKAIIALTVSLTLKDVTGETLGDAVTYQYLDLLVGRDQSCCEDVPIVIENRGVRSFDAKVRTVVFANNTTWQGPDEDWKSLAPAQPLHEAFNDPVLEREYGFLLTTAGGQVVNCIYTPVEDLWYCACGLLNHDDETHCHYCGRSREKMAMLDRPLIAERAAERQAAEARQREEAEQKAAQRREEQAKARAESMKKVKRTSKKVAIVAIPLIIIGAIAGKFIYDYLQDKAEYEQNSNNYAFAQELMDEKNYEAAARQFKSLGDFQDSAHKAEEAEKLMDEQAYNEAVEALNEGRSAEAYAGFKKLDDYKDSEALTDTAYLQNQLDGFPRTRGYFVSHKDDYILVNEEEVATVLFGTWIFCEPSLSNSSAMTKSTLIINADGSGSQEEDGVTMDIQWIFDDKGFRYTYSTDSSSLTDADTVGNELRKIADGAYGIFTKDDSGEMALLISSGSDWGKRYEQAVGFATGTYAVN